MAFCTKKILKTPELLPEAGTRGQASISPLACALPERKTDCRAVL